MFKRRVNGASRDRVYRASSACVACPDGLPLLYNDFKMTLPTCNWTQHNFIFAVMVVEPRRELLPDSIKLAKQE